jgi:hypothetical protein
VVIAALMVASQFVPLHWHSAVAVISQSLAAAPASNVPSAVELPSSDPSVLPPVAIDRQMAEARFSQWAESPRRDPFRLVPFVSDLPVHAYPSPVLGWKLQAIWRQTGGRIATINNRIYAEGDKVQGYRIQKIEADQVWFDGPDGPEALSFPQPGAAPGKKKP